MNRQLRAVAVMFAGVTALVSSGCSYNRFVGQDEAINRLMDELSGTENRLAVERMRYNERVQEYNTSRRQFPANVTAGIFGFKEYPLFNAPPEAERLPRVDFGRQS